MFWGFVLEPKKRYNTTVSKAFHISMAALDPKTVHDNDINSVVLNIDGSETILCNLGKPHYLQERLDLNFIEGNSITLEVKGKASVHLSGYFIYEQDEGMDDSDLDDEELDDEEEDETFDEENIKALRKQLKKQNSKKNKMNATTTEEEDSDEDDDDDDSMDVSDLTFDDDEDDEDDDDDEEDDSEEEEEEKEKIASPGSTPMPKAKKLKISLTANTSLSAVPDKKSQSQNNTPNKKNKGQNQQQTTPNIKQEQKTMTNGNTPVSNKKKKNKDGNASANASPNKQQQQGGDNKAPRKSLEGGVIVEDIKVGTGVPAKNGKMVSVHYVGKLKNNNKQFDSSTQGPGFKFRLGKGEVIKGWDVGVSGMKVGGKRRLTIPAHMAYGNKGSPPAIPPNSTLVFDVELKNVN